MDENTSTAVQKAEKENSPVDFAVSEDENDSSIVGFPQAEENPAEETSLEGNSAEINEILNECEQIKIEPNSSPVEIRAGQMASVPSVFLGNNGRSAAITKNGDLYGWGLLRNSTVPVKILSNVVSFSGIRFFTPAAITDNGDLYCWGSNLAGEVGNGSKEWQVDPVKVLSDVVSVSGFDSSHFVQTGVGDAELPLGYDACTVSAITSNKDLYCWGCNEHGRVGNGNTEDQTIPVKILSNVTFFSGFNRESSNTIAAITKNGDLYCWGNNCRGQVGNGTTEDQTTPVKVLDNVAFVADFDSSTTAVITKNGDLYCWGYNFYGQVGNGTTENQTTPAKVLSNVTSVFNLGSDTSVLSA